MWLLDSSVGRKVVMSITGSALLLFLVFHGSMNVVALFSSEAYNAICAFLGANWYALLASAGLALLVFAHFIYAFILEYRNIKAVGGFRRYSRKTRPKQVEWSSQNMFVLGLIVVLGLALHLVNFWAKMQFQEIIGSHGVMLNGILVGPTDGAAIIAFTFSNIWIVALYLIWLSAIWFHLSHGFWSALQTMGWNNQIWLSRWQVIGKIFVTLVVLMFVSVVLVFYLKSAGVICLP